MTEQTAQAELKRHVIGLAFTSPTIVVPAIDKAKFKVCLFEGVTSSLQDFISPTEGEPERKRIVLVRSLQEYRQIKDVAGVHAFIIHDDPTILLNVNGLNVFDCSNNAAHMGWRKIKFKPHQLNALLESDPSEYDSQIVLPDAEPLAKKLRKSAGFCDLLNRALSPLGTDQRASVEWVACSYAVGLLTKRSWTTKVLRPVRVVAQSLESLIELERFVESSRECDALWRSYYDHAEQDVALEEAAAKYKHCNLDDLKHICTIVPPVVGAKYVMIPTDFPYAS